MSSVTATNEATEITEEEEDLKGRSSKKIKEGDVVLPKTSSSLPSLKAGTDDEGQKKVHVQQRSYN